MLSMLWRYNLLIFIIFSSLATELDTTYVYGTSKGKVKDIAKDFYKAMRGKDLKFFNNANRPKEVNEDQREVCIECNEITKFSSDILEILKEVKRSSPKTQLPKIETELLKLETIVIYTQIISNNGEILCHEVTNFNKTDDYKDFRYKDLELVFTDKRDLEKLKTFNIDSNSASQKITWLRSTNPLNEDIFVKVVSVKGQPNYFQIYYAKDLLYDPRNDRMSRKLPELGKELPKSSSKKYMALAKDEEFDTGLGKLVIEEGLALEQRYNIPTSFTLIKAKSESNLTDNFAIKSKIELSESDQDLELKFDYDETEVIKAKLDAGGDFKIAIPITSPTIDGIQLRSTIGYDSNKNTNLKGNILVDGDVYLSFGAKIDHDGSNYMTLNKKVEIFKGGIVSFELQHSSEGDLVHAVDLHNANNQGLHRFKTGDSTSAYIRFEIPF